MMGENGQWSLGSFRRFMSHGAPVLVVEPRPAYFRAATTNPYDDPANPPADPETLLSGVCGIRWTDDGDDNRSYELRDFPGGAAAAGEAGFAVTHFGQCGACSSLQDLGVYMSRNLTRPTRLCGALGFVSRRFERECLKGLGFSDECLSIWHWNIENTVKACFQVCMLSWIHGEPNNKPDGSLNDCLQCDEDNSGPNFKFFSGRTRRNSGIPSAIWRPPDQIFNLTHCYWYGNLSQPVISLD